jgi:hypothetical protein
VWEASELHPTQQQAPLTTICSVAACLLWKTSVAGLAKATKNFAGKRLVGLELIVARMLASSQFALPATHCTLLRC